MKVSPLLRCKLLLVITMYYVSEETEKKKIEI